MSRRTNALPTRPHHQQMSLESTPNSSPDAFLVWKTKTLKLGSRRNPETWEFYETTCKGHTFRVGLLPQGIIAESPEPPPSQWSRAVWQLMAEFNQGEPLEFMGSLIGCRTKQEALELAERKIVHFISQKKLQYDHPSPETPSGSGPRRYNERRTGQRRAP